MSSALDNIIEVSTQNSLAASQYRNYTRNEWRKFNNEFEKDFNKLNKTVDDTRINAMKIFDGAVGNKTVVLSDAEKVYTRFECSFCTLVSGVVLIFTRFECRLQIQFENIMLKF